MYNLPLEENAGKFNGYICGEPFSALG